MSLKKNNQNFVFFNFISLIFFACLFSVTYGQNGVAINTTGASADNSAILDLRNSVNKGLLLPQVNSTSSVSSPYEGLVVYQNMGTKGIYYYTGSTWILLSSSMGTVTGVAASSPLSSSGGATPNITLSGIVPVSNGGTGVATTSGYSVFGNFGTVTAPPSFNAATADGQFLVRRSTGLSFGTILATDLPSLAGNYIQNQMVSAQTANFWINGSGRIDGGPVNLNSPTTGNNVSATYINSPTGSGVINSGTTYINSPTGSGVTNSGITNVNTNSTGNVYVGGAGAYTGTGQVIAVGGGTSSQTINLGANITSPNGTPSTVNLGSNADGVTTTILGGAGGVLINNTTSNRTTTIGGTSGNQNINIGSFGAAGTIAIGSSATTTTVNGTPVNINVGNNKITNINTGTTTGAVNIGTGTGDINVGGSNTGQTLYIGATEKSGTINIGTSTGDAGSTKVNINSGATGSGAININAATGGATPTNINTGTTSGPVSIGNSTAGNIYMPGFTTAGSVLYSSTTGGLIAATTAGTSGQVLTSNGAGAPTWNSVGNLTFGQSANTVFGNTALNSFSSSTFTLVPGLTTSVTVPTTGTYSVYIATDGGFETLSNGNNGFSIIDVGVAIDGFIVNNGLYERVSALNNSNVGTNYNYWGMSSIQSISSGTAHTIAVYAKDINNSGNGEVISGDQNSVLQGQLTVILIKQ